MVRPPNNAITAASQRMSWPAIPYSTITQTKPATRAAAAGLGSPWKKRLSVTVSIRVLKRARRRAGAIDEGSDPAELAHALQGEFVDHQRRRHTERHHVGQAVVLGTEGALGKRHTGDAAIEAVEHHGDENRYRREFEAAVHRLHDREEAGEQCAGCEQVGQQIDAAVTHPGALRFGFSVMEVEHGKDCGAFARVTSEPVWYARP